MILNELILKAMENNKPKNIERFDKMGLDMLHDSVKSDSINLVEFTTLADIYNVKYTITVDTGILVYSFNEESILWAELDNIYYEATQRRLNSYNLTFKEIQEKFNKLCWVIEIQ